MARCAFALKAMLVGLAPAPARAAFRRGRLLHARVRTAPPALSTPMHAHTRTRMQHLVWVVCAKDLHVPCGEHRDQVAVIMH
jgi:hypothetical protein